MAYMNYPSFGWYAWMLYPEEHRKYVNIHIADALRP
jgi:hypothetical protein